MSTLEKIRGWFFFINRENLKRPVFWLALLGMLFIALLIVGIPSYLSIQNQYCASCHSMEPYYKTWKDSTHANQNCVECHVEPNFKSYLYHYLRSTRELYTNLIRGTPGHSRSFTKPTVKICFRCHTEYRTISPGGDLKIPHRAHVKMRGLACVDCHRYLVHYKNPEGKNTPSMITCYKCHNGVKAPKECKACHTKKAYPDTHRDPNWLPTHGEIAKITGGKDCAKCHGWTPRYCEECHQKRPASHAGIIWRTNHKYQAKVRGQGCLVCHGGNFCLNCHDEVPKP